MDARLAALLGEVLGLDAAHIHADLSKDDVDKWDSLKQMDLVVSLEQAYGITLEITDIVNMLSVSGIVDVLREKGVAVED